MHGISCGQTFPSRKFIGLTVFVSPVLIGGLFVVYGACKPGGSFLLLSYWSIFSFNLLSLAGLSLTAVQRLNRFLVVQQPNSFFHFS
jgi:hypothetical protein